MKTQDDPRNVGCYTVDRKPAIPAGNSSVTFLVPSDKITSSSRGRIDGPLGDIGIEEADVVDNSTNELPATTLISEFSVSAGITDRKQH